MKSIWRDQSRLIYSKWVVWSCCADHSCSSKGTIYSRMWSMSLSPTALLQVLFPSLSILSTQGINSASQTRLPFKAVSRLMSFHKIGPRAPYVPSWQFIRHQQVSLIENVFFELTEWCSVCLVQSFVSSLSLSPFQCAFSWSFLSCCCAHSKLKTRCSTIFCLISQSEKKSSATASSCQVHAAGRDMFVITGSQTRLMKHGSRRTSSFSGELRLHTLVPETGIRHSSSKYIRA